MPSLMTVVISQLRIAPSTVSFRLASWPLISSQSAPGPSVTSRFSRVKPFSTTSNTLAEAGSFLITRALMLS
jgi:hypothetical protein